MFSRVLIIPKPDVKSVALCCHLTIHGSLAACTQGIHGEMGI